MTGKELIQNVFRHEKTPRTPWVPFAGVHAGKMAGYAAQELLKDADKLYKSLMEVHRLYMPDGMPVCFDLQLEAEALGCELLWAEKNPPSVMTHSFDSTDEIPAQAPGRNAGRIPVIMEAASRLKESVGDTTAIYGLFCGPFTLASHLRGTKLFMDMKKNSEYVHKLLDFCALVGKKMIDAYAECGVDVIAPVDPLVSQISPVHFTTYLTAPYTDLFSYIRKKSLFSSFFVCGNALRNIEEMCKTNPDGISIDENIPMHTAKEISDRYNKVIGGNIPLTTVMLFGKQQDNMKFVVNMVDSVEPMNLIVSPGCDMPYDTPMENTIAVAETVRDIDKYRELIKNYESLDETIEVELPDYKNLKKPLLECCTLDSASCAACTYMWAVVNDAKKKYGDGIDIVEYKYTRREDIARFKKMGIANLPSLYINGELAYASIIPSHEELYIKIDGLI
jgi:uroporphyrinogen decarboxylase